MMVKDILAKLGVSLKLPSSVLEYPVEGKYNDIEIGESDGDMFYTLRDDTHSIILSETYDYSMVYETFENRDLPPHAIILDSNGLLAGIS